MVGSSLMTDPVTKVGYSVNDKCRLESGGCQKNNPQSYEKPNEDPSVSLL